MNPSRSPEPQVVKFSRLLTELEIQLRLSYGDNLSLEPAWPVCSRLNVQADLLGGLAGEWGLGGFGKLAECIAGLASLGQEEPKLIPLSWNCALNRLAALLDEMMAGLDAGDAPADWLDDPRWERLAGWFRNLDSPLLVLDEMEEILLRWQNSWCDVPLDSAQEIELQQRWTRLRGFGDALLGPSSSDPGTGLLKWK